MKRGSRSASRWGNALRISLVLMTLTALVALSGCAMRGGQNGSAGQAGQQSTGQQAGGQQPGSGQTTWSNDPSQQVQNADQQI